MAQGPRLEGSLCWRREVTCRMEAQSTKQLCFIGLTAEGQIRGVMAMGPLTSDPTPVFTRVARALADQLGYDLPVLSLGMTGDLREAVAAGSTMIRVGTGLFGPRPYPRQPCLETTLPRDNTASRQRCPARFSRLKSGHCVAQSLLLYLVLATQAKPGEGVTYPPGTVLLSCPGEMGGRCCILPRHGSACVLSGSTCSDPHD